MKLAGRRALITGGSRGFGKCLAQTFWREGASLLLIARTATDLATIRESLTSSAKPQQVVHTLTLDLAGNGAIEKVVAEAKRLFGGLDILVNNAGNQGPIGPLMENDWREWEDSIRINFLVPAALCRAMVPFMAGRPGGSIINLSGGGATGPRPNFSSYASAKVALVRLSELLAQEVRDQGIRVNCLAPGAMYSRMQDAILDAGPRQAGEKDFHAAAELKANAVRDDGAVARRAAELCVFLASDESRGITGKLISAAWDPWRDLPRYRDELMNRDVYTLRRIVPADRGLNWKET